MPSLGGIEVVSATLAEKLTAKGIQCTVVTETTSQYPDNYSYKVIRNPSFIKRLKLVKNHDLIHSNGASLALFFISKLLLKPFCWTHGGYQLSCIDGLGWVEGEKAPLSPWPSINYHKKKRGFTYAIKEGLKLYLRRWVGNIVDANIAVTNWVASRQPLSKQRVIYNPFPLDNFYIIKESPKKYDFVFLGRLVSEKGVPDLIKAFDIVHKKFPTSKLLIIGDGNWRAKLEELTTSLQHSDNIHFAGKRSGKELNQLINEGTIAVIPSVWEEPMGGVSIELLKAGLNIIVSKNGGLSECVGKAGETFVNGDHNDLAEKMEKLLKDEGLRKQQRNEAEYQISKFNPDLLVQEYIDLYQSLLKT